MRISRPKPYTCFATTFLLSILFSSSARGAEELYRSPTDLLLSRDETQILTTNATAGTVSLIDRTTGAVHAELASGSGPYALAHSADRTQVVVTARDSRELILFKWEDGQISRAGAVTLASEPHGVAMTGDGAVAYVALRNEGVVAVIDLSARSITDRIAVGSWPTHLALSRDSRRLAVAVHGECGIAVVDTATKKRDFLEDFQGINFGHLRVSPDDQFVYFPWMVYRRNPISKSNIRQGWVLASRVARVDLREHKRRDAIALDPQGEAVADPHGLDLSTGGQRMVVTASGTHELLVYRVEGLPFQDYGGPGDHIDAGLLADKDRFFRIPLGGRPMGVRVTADGETAFVANYLLDAVQEVDLNRRAVVRSILLSTAEPSLTRQGEAAFFDAKHSHDQWYSCHSCHYEGGSNAVTVDTKNDGTAFSYKVVPSLRNVTETGPWMWHGWQEDLADAIHRSLTETMEGPEPENGETLALRAYLESFRSQPGPGLLSEAALLGQSLFRGKARCHECHRGSYLTDGLVHDVGTGKPTDAYDGFNTPSLIGVSQKVIFLHDGRESRLEDLLGTTHSPERLGKGPALSEEEISCLVAYLRTL